MEKKNIYEVFIGLLALMISIMLILELIVILPNEVLSSFYYIDIIVYIIFVLDYIVRFLMARNKVTFIFKNIVDLFSIIPLSAYILVFRYLYLNSEINPLVIIKIIGLIRLSILILKFKSKIKDLIRVNRFNYVLILTTLVIVMSSVIISLVEEMSFGDALWWCFVTFTTVGYGDILLTTSMGRVIAAILMIVGIGFIGVTTSTIALYIITGGREKRKNNIKDELIEAIKYKLDTFDDLSAKDIEDIYKTLKSLKR